MFLLFQFQIFFSQFRTNYCKERLHFFFFNYLFYLFLAALGLRWCTRAFSSCGECGLLFVVVRMLIVVAPLVAEHGL